MEKRVPLTPPEINEWDAIIKKGQNISRPQDTAELKDIIVLFMSSVQNFSNRSMRIENFTISYNTAKTMSGGLGIIRYEFMWKNFSRTESGKIYIGDAFSRGMMLPSGNLLTIEIPSDYEVESVSPKYDSQDGNLLIWEGAFYQKFGIGEPALVLSRKVTTPEYWPVIVSLVILMSVVSLIFWKKRVSRESNGIDEHTKKIESSTVTKENNISRTEINTPTTGAPQIADTEISPHEITGDLTHVPSEIDLGDEEMIEKLLSKSGGQAYQSDIVKESRFSKSKISIVLAKMKEDGRIIKIKKGKENIIRLVKK